MFDIELQSDWLDIEFFTEQLYTSNQTVFASYSWVAL